MCVRVSKKSRRAPKTPPETDCVEDIEVALLLQRCYWFSLLCSCSERGPHQIILSVGQLQICSHFLHPRAPATVSVSAPCCTVFARRLNWIKGESLIPCYGSDKRTNRLLLLCGCRYRAHAVTQNRNIKFQSLDSRRRRLFCCARVIYYSWLCLECSLHQLASLWEKTVRSRRLLRGNNRGRLRNCWLQRQENFKQVRQFFNLKKNNIVASAARKFIKSCTYRRQRVECHDDEEIIYSTICR